MLVYLYIWNFTLGAIGSCEFLSDMMNLAKCIELRASRVDRSLGVSCLIHNWPNEKIDFTIPKLFSPGIKPNNSTLSRKINL
jgi:hypothetical protein